MSDYLISATWITIVLMFITWIKFVSMSTTLMSIILTAFEYSYFTILVSYFLSEMCTISHGCTFDGLPTRHPFKIERKRVFDN